MKLAKIFLTCCLSLVGVSGFSQTPTFSTANNRLTLPSVQVDGSTYTNVVVQLNSIQLISMDSPNTTPVAATCTSRNFSTAIFNAIRNGMTLDQVNKTIGCLYDPSSTVRLTDKVNYFWTVPNVLINPPMIMVIFDNTGSVVTDSSVFKMSSGF